MTNESYLKKKKSKKTCNNSSLHDFNRDSELYGFLESFNVYSEIKKTISGIDNYHKLPDLEKPFEDLDSLINKFSDTRNKDLLHFLVENGKRRGDMESILLNDYKEKFEEIFSFFETIPECVDIYQMEDECNEEKLFGDFSERCSGKYLHNLKTMVFRKRMVDEHMVYGVIHENVHHNLRLFRDKNNLCEKDTFVEEGITEFIAQLIFGKDRDSLSKEIREKYPDYLPEERDVFGAPYHMGEQYFSLIYESLGIEGVVDAYSQASNLTELNEFMYMNNVDIKRKGRISHI